MIKTDLVVKNSFYEHFLTLEKECVRYIFVYMKKILVMVASPKNECRGTLVPTKAFVQGLEKKWKI